MSLGNFSNDYYVLFSFKNTTYLAGGIREYQLAKPANPAKS